MMFKLFLWGIFIAFVSYGCSKNSTGVQDLDCYPVICSMDSTYQFNFQLEITEEDKERLGYRDFSMALFDSNDNELTIRFLSYHIIPDPLEDAGEMSVTISMDNLQPGDYGVVINFPDNTYYTKFCAETICNDEDR